MSRLTLHRYKYQTLQEQGSPEKDSCRRSYVLSEGVKPSSTSGNSSSSNGTTGIMSVFESSESKGKWTSEGSAGLESNKPCGIRKCHMQAVAPTSSQPFCSK